MEQSAIPVAPDAQNLLAVQLTYSGTSPTPAASRSISSTAPTTIPSNALDAKDFPSIDAWLDACVAKGVAGKIGPGTYQVDGLPRYAPVGIYGYGDPPPKFVSDAPSGAWLYVHDANTTLDHVAFEGFGKVLVGAVDLSDGNPFHSPTDYGFKYIDTAHEALAMDVEANTSAITPDVTINDCQFINVESVLTLASDTAQIGAVTFTNNVAVGTWGLVDINAPLWTDVVATGNEWRDATGARAQPTYKSNGVQTGFKIGTEKTIDVDGRVTHLDISHNQASNIDSYSSSSDYNAAVFADVRGAISKSRGDNSISFNDISHLRGVLGQEDSNAIYAKAWGLIIEGNHIKNSGAAYVNDARNGSEATGILVKPFWDGVAKDIEIINNVFEDMPVVQAGIEKELAVIKLSEAVGHSAISGNIFIGGGNLSSSNSAGIIRYYGTLENLQVKDNQFKDVVMAKDAQAIVFNQLSKYGKVVLEVSNNSAELSKGTYTADANWIGFTSKVPGALITGHNSLGHNHEMLSDRVGSPAQQTPDSAVAPLLIGKVAIAASTNVELSDDRFYLDKGNLYLKGDYIDTLKGGDAVELVIVARQGSGWSAVMLHVTNQGASQDTVSYSLTNVATIKENSTAEIKVASIDADVPAGVTYEVSDSRFIAKDGGIYLRSGSSVDYEKESSIRLAVTAHIGDASISKEVAVGVTDVNDAPTALTISNSRLLSAASADAKLADIAVIDPDMNPAFRAYSFTVSDNRFVVKDNGLYLKQGASVDYAQGSLALKITASDGSFEIPATFQVRLSASDSAGPPPVPAGPVGGNSDSAAIHGGSSSDLLTGTGYDDRIYGHEGNDVLNGGLGNDRLFGGEGSDRLVGGAGIDTADYGSATAAVRVDILKPTVNTGEAKGDSYSSIENVTGSNFDDRIAGTHGANELIGGNGNDELFGRGDGDLLVGGAGNDYLAGEGGNDRLNGGLGDDILDGGRSSADYFIFDRPDWGRDRVVGFEDNLDKIDMRGSGLSFADLILSQSASGAVISTHAGASILLEQMNTAQLTSSDFLF
jgi:Ca2+-binding RTX toxin-like protein